MTTLTPLYSQFADDDFLSELVVQYVAEMPMRIAKIEAILADHDFDALRTFAHQMKGSAGSYGFDELSAAAEILERDAQLQRVECKESARELIQLCQCVSSEVSPAQF